MVSLLFLFTALHSCQKLTLQESDPFWEGTQGWQCSLYCPDSARSEQNKDQLQKETFLRLSPEHKINKSEHAAGLVAATEPMPLLFIWQGELQCLHRKEILSFHQTSLPHSRTPMIRYSSWLEKWTETKILLSHYSPDPVYIYTFQGSYQPWLLHL